MIFRHKHLYLMTRMISSKQKGILVFCSIKQGLYEYPQEGLHARYLCSAILSKFFAFFEGENRVKFIARRAGRKYAILEGVENVSLGEK